MTTAARHVCADCGQRPVSQRRDSVRCEECADKIRNANTGEPLRIFNRGVVPPAEREVAEKLNASIAAQYADEGIVLKPEGILGECWVRSESQPGKEYRMYRSAGGWQHADSGCRAWHIRGRCRHVEELMGETMTNELIIAPRPVLALIDELEDTAIIEAVSGKVSETWVYEFRGPDGKPVRGLSVIGVENAAREAAKKGEAIREIDCRLEYEDDREARFVARAGRYAIGANGQEVLLDVAIRAKRQPKWGKRAQGGGEYFIDAWYEIGVSKANRNAKAALLPEEVRE